MCVCVFLALPGDGLHTGRKDAAWNPWPNSPLLPEPGRPAPPDYEILRAAAE